MEQIKDLITTLNNAVRAVPAGEELAIGSRLHLVAQVDALREAIAPPQIQMLELIWDFQRLVAARIAIGMGVFDAFAAAQHKAMSLSELDAQTKGSSQLLGRVMRRLTVGNLFREVDSDRWQPLGLATLLVSGTSHVSAIKQTYLELRTNSHLYEYLEMHDFEEPDDAFDGPPQMALNTKKHFVDWMHERPEVAADWNNMMTAQSKFRGQDWFDFYPVADRLKPDNAEDIILVDIGGGQGQDVTALKRRFPDLPGYIVLQDLPATIESISEPLAKGIRTMKYDMFTPQPVKRAKAYYMRTVLHDWPDKQALEALKNIRDAMDPQSVLLLNENCLPERNAPLGLVAVDFVMMSMFSSKERTALQWQNLLKRAGFVVKKTWMPSVQGIGATALFEAQLG